MQLPLQRQPVHVHLHASASPVPIWRPTDFSGADAEDARHEGGLSCSGLGRAARVALTGQLCRAAQTNAGSRQSKCAATHPHHSSCSGSWQLCDRSRLTLIGCDSLQLFTVRTEWCLETQRRARVRACSCCDTLRGQCERQQRCGHQRRGMRTHRGGRKRLEAATGARRRLSSECLSSRCANAISHCRPCLHSCASKE